MIRVLLVSILFISQLISDTTIKLEKGWQFVGFPSDVENTTLLHNANVDIVWSYDANNQKWLGFSPNNETSNKITSNGYEKITSIKAWQGVWIHNKADWALTLPDSEQSDAKITLEKGWNLISLPADMTISPTLFNENIVWRYHDKTWQLSNKNQDSTDIAPPISKIDSAEAIWVKSERAHIISLAQETSKLHTFTSKEAMKEYIKEMVLESYKPRYYDYPIVFLDIADGVVLEAANGVDEASLSAPTTEEDAASQKADDATGTNLQESDVDESDILKHNGEHIYFYNRAKNQIHITTFLNLSTAQQSAISPISLPANTYLQAMYLNGDKLIMISNQQRYYYFAEIEFATADIASIPSPIKQEQETFDVDIFDISDVNNINKIQTTTIDGSYNNSRIVESELYLISQFSPRLEIEYPKIYIDIDKCDNVAIPMLAYEDGRYIPECAGEYYEDGKYFRYDYTKPTIKSSYLIPTINNGKMDLITHDTLYAPHKLNQFPTITSISKFDLTNNSFEKSVSTVGYTNKLYASSKNIYLTSVHYPYYYDFRNFSEREMIYKFSIGEDFDYQARGFVDGIMLNQFSMSEKDDILRVATTSGSGWRGDTINSVFTLHQNGENLEVAGTLTGLGKPNETIRGVRFLGDRGYVVTFLQTDPLYTIDMSNPSAPQKVGELEINGFSSYIHPVNDDYILTLGRDADNEGRVGGFALQLFDISDFSNPFQADEKIYSAALYGFDAEYTNQAFIYRNSDNLFGITYSNSQNQSIMDILQVNTTTGSIEEIDNISFTGGSYERRGIIFNQNEQRYGALFSGEIVETKDIGAVQ